MISSRRVKTVAAAWLAGSLGVQLAVELRVRARGRAAGGRGGLVDERDRGLGPAQRLREHALDRLELAVVAAHGGGEDAAVQGRVAERVRLDREPHDDLLVGVEDVERERARADAGDRDQRAHLDRVAEPERLREVLVEEARQGGGLGRGLLGARLAVEQREPAVRVADRQALAVHAAVEGVVERRGGGADAARAELQMLGQRGARGVQIGPFWEQTGEHSRASLAQELLGSGLTAILTPDPLSGRPRRPPERGQRGSMSSGNAAVRVRPRSRRACGGVETASPALCGGPLT